MRLRLELCLNNGRKLIAAEEIVSFDQSGKETLKMFMMVSKSLVVKLVQWVWSNQDEFVREIRGEINKEPRET